MISLSWWHIIAFSIKYWIKLYILEILKFSFRDRNNISKFYYLQYVKYRKYIYSELLKQETIFEIFTIPLNAMKNTKVVNTKCD